MCFLLKCLEMSSEISQSCQWWFCLSKWWVNLCYVRLLSFREFSSVAQEADGAVA